MDAAELSKRYMAKYDELILNYENAGIHNSVLELNEAIDKEDVPAINELYNKVLEWNASVEKLEGARIAIDAQYSYLHLPSPTMYSIIFDWDEKVWKFNTEEIE